MNPLVVQFLTGGLAAIFLIFALVVAVLLVRSNKRDSSFSTALPGAVSEAEEQEQKASRKESTEEELEFDFRSAAPTVSRIEVTGPDSQPYIPPSDAPELSDFTPTRPAARPTGRRAATPGGATQSGTGRRARQAGVPAPQPRRDNR